MEQKTTQEQEIVITTENNKELEAKMEAISLELIKENYELYKELENA